MMGNEQHRSCILTDEEIRCLSDFTSYPDTGVMCETDGNGQIVGGFMGLVQEAAEAVAEIGELSKLHSLQQKIVFALRVMYLLGVQRGGEAYRNCQVTNCGHPEYIPLPFSLNRYMIPDVVDDLNRLQPEQLARLLAPLGLADLTKRQEVGKGAAV